MNTDTTIQRAKAKDPKALDEIYTMYYPKMIGICMNIVKEDEDTTRDLVHDAFILAFASLDKLRDNEKFVEWLTTIVRNVALKHLVQQEKLHFVPLSQIPPNDDALLDESSTADSNINYQEILTHIAQLPEGYRKVFRLSVIEGFSHKEIADILGIEPHSSSSQLSRAKAILKHLLGYKMLVIIFVLLISVPLYLIMLRHDEPHVSEIKPIKKKDERQNTPAHSEDKANSASQPIKRHTGKINNGYNKPDSITIPSSQDLYNTIEEQQLITETTGDSTIILPADSVVIPNIDPELFLTHDGKTKKSNWEFLAAGSLGPALAENVYKLIATDNAGHIDSDGPTNINTWEDYSQYLHSTRHENTPADTLTLIEIADHNNGDIVEREEHDKPIVFGLSFSKTLNDRWSIETGLQYSILNSRFNMGDSISAIVKKQKVHYLGVPLKVSYRLIDYKQLSSYSSAGLTLHIPVYGKMNSNYMVNQQTAYSDDRHFTPPFQWQTSFSVGLQYKFTSNTSIFVEPTLNWFISSSSEPRTIWTAHPVMFTSPFGIRIIW
ncbi:MAG: sigma-70 family RNA polymerase sigma factor [Prevotella sp.]|nr:sigma-70 family RNA polymerase sigma factor [Prevotella sp.]